MISCSFRRHRAGTATIEALYGTIVAQARPPSFYRDYGVPDTVNGRFDMIVLHLVLVLGGCAAQRPKCTRLGQAVFDLFCQDMDDNFREMGVGDLAVPKEMRRVAEAFYGRPVLRGGLGGADDRDALVARADAQCIRSAEPPLGPQPLAAYMRRTPMRQSAR